MNEVCIDAKGGFEMKELKEVEGLKLTPKEEIVVNLFLYKQICEKKLLRVPEGNTFNDWIKAGSDFSMLNVSDAIHGLMRLNPALQESSVFNTLQTSMASIMGENGKIQAKNTSRIVWALNKVDSGMEISDFVEAMKKNRLGLAEKKRSPESGLSL